MKRALLESGEPADDLSVGVRASLYFDERQFSDVGTESVIDPCRTSCNSGSSTPIVARQICPYANSVKITNPAFRKDETFLRPSWRRGKCHRYARNSACEAVVLAGAQYFHNRGLQVDSDIGGFVR